MHRRSMGALVLTLLIAVLLLGCGDSALEAVPGTMLEGVP